MTATTTNSGWFDTALSPITEPAICGFRDDLAAEPGLRPAEQECLVEALVGVLRDTTGRLASRVLLLELNAARVRGRLSAPDPAARWQEFVDGCADPAWWEQLAEHYPTLLPRLRAVVANRRRAAQTMARRLVADRRLLPAGELTAVGIGSGDSHQGGQTVNRIRLGDTDVIYKPRSLAVDAALATFLDGLRESLPALAVRVPAVVDRGPYGWAHFVEHRFCTGEDELRTFYRGTGQWLALMRLLGGGDLHGENLIACGPSPYVVDCETVIAPVPQPPPSGLGEANDRAAALIGASVLRVGLLPTRGIGLFWRGVDISAVGGLPGQQPRRRVPIMIDAGLDTARLGYRLVDIEQPVTNHPHPRPQLGRHWNDVLTGFTELTGRLTELDRAGRLEPMLDRFRDCRIRVITRDTEVYAEHLRMLWHPTSLHDEPDAVAQAAALLRTQGQNTPGASGDPNVVAAEIHELLHGDIPIYTTTPRVGQLDAPGGLRSGPRADLVTASLRRWRDADLPLESKVIRASLVGAYLNEGWLPDLDRLSQPPARIEALARRRRAVAADLVGRLIAEAITAEDGTATWIAPVLDATGWQVQTSSAEIYNGLHGLAVVLTGYRSEVAAGRADPVPGADEMLEAVVRSMELAEDRQHREATGELPLRPPPPGGYIGIGAQIWAWLVLDRLGAGGPRAVERAVDLGAQLPAAIAADELVDVLGGAAGALVPLLWLAEHTGEDRWIELAVKTGRRLELAARHDGAVAYWPTERWQHGIGGFSHGSTGIGWALARLSEVTGEFGALAEAAFAHEETLYHPPLTGWLDVREPEPVTRHAWCHGAVGIGVAAADLLARTGDERHRDVLRRAAASVWANGMGWTHTLCHGDLGCWEVLDAALAVGIGPDGLDRTSLDAMIIGSLEANGPVSGLVRDTFAPGLMAGIGGMPYQLLRMDPDCPLPSVLSLDLP